MSYFFLKKNEAQQFIPVTELEAIGKDFFEKIKEKMKQEDDIHQ